MALRLTEGRIDAKPTTAYLMTYASSRCSANCAFCPQAQESRAGIDMLSRVTWPPYNLEDVITALAMSKGVRRVCIQAANYRGALNDILRIIQRITASRRLEISVSCYPLPRRDLLALKRLNVDRIAISLDASSPTLFRKIKGKGVGGPYTWSSHIQALKDSIAVFGKGKVTTHLIVGLGETDLDLMKILEKTVSLGVLPALFAFTPIRGTKLENAFPPEVSRYRFIQLLRSYIVAKGRRPRDISFDRKGKVAKLGLTREELDWMLSSDEPFLTSGCPYCNRPYYNENAGGPIYNYPRHLTAEEMEKVGHQILNLIS